MDTKTNQTPTAQLAMVTLDCAETRPVTEFWANLLGMEVAHLDADYGMLTGNGTRIGFGRIEGWTPPVWPDEKGSKQFHFDLAVDDLGVAKTRCEELGATAADPQPGDTWIVMLDPAGRPFCLTQAQNWG